jgi:hypothetical protein
MILIQCCEFLSPQCGLVKHLTTLANIIKINHYVEEHLARHDTKRFIRDAKTS